MKAKDVKWCPQHGYPLPCYKCGMPLLRTTQKEIYEAGKKAGIKEVVEWIKENNTSPEGLNWITILKITEKPEEWQGWQAKLKDWFKDNPKLLKEWGIE